jgi:biopolymer transport protein ExbD
MALKRQFDLSATYSMASMTDVIFLLLIFFMVTSTFVFPNALEVNLPESSATTSLKPEARIYLGADGQIKTIAGDGTEWTALNEGESVESFIALIKQQQSAETADTTAEAFVALYADTDVPYGQVVNVLNLGAKHDVKVVLATKAPETTTAPTPSEP